MHTEQWWSCSSTYAGFQFAPDCTGLEVAQPMYSTLGSRHLPHVYVKMTNPQGYLTADLASQAREQDKERSILIVSSFLSQPAAPVAFLSQSATFHHHLLLRFLQFNA